MEEIRGWTAFYDKYKPIKNHLSSSSDDYVFETYGDDLDFVRSQDPKKIWTWVDGDMSSLLVAGYHFVNRIGYHIAEIPWTDENEYVVLSEEVECECYKEDGYENGEYGSPDCEVCEGYGYVTEYA
jgi:hypothetical protein